MPRAFRGASPALLALLQSRVLFEQQQRDLPPDVHTDCPAGSGKPCGPGNEQCGPAFVNPPQFHIQDATCVMNDPNGPFYDPLHKMYHVMYQDHLCEPREKGVDPSGPVWAHVVSRDMVHWARLPVALWNDRWFDNRAVFTGSTTVVNGTPTIVYPGISSIRGTFNVARPANRSDPLLVRWDKVNIVNDTSDDPSTAWRTRYGEWRLIGNGMPAPPIGEVKAPLYASPDFVNWTLVGFMDTFPQGECPTVFPLAPPTELGDINSSEQPTHAHLVNNHASLGSLVDGRPGKVSTWAPCSGCAYAEQPLDMGAYYAAKDFWDPVGSRRVLWGWGVVDQGFLTIPRRVDFDPDLGQLVFSPLKEQAQLRESRLGGLSGPSVQVPSGGGFWFGDWEPGRGNQSEVIVRIRRPTTRAVFGVDLVCSDQGGPVNSSTRLYIDYDPRLPGRARVGLTNGASNLTSLMPNTTLDGGDYATERVGYADYRPCQAKCQANASGCAAWTYTARGFDNSSYCSLKAAGAGFVFSPMNDTATSGVLLESPGAGGTADTLLIKTDENASASPDDAFEIRAFVDNTIVEAYFQGGRVAMTMPVQGGDPAGTAGVSVFAYYGQVELESADAWAVGSIWTSVESVLSEE